MAERRDAGAPSRGRCSRSGPAASLTAQSLHCTAGRAIYARGGGGLSELDGQMLLDLDAGREERARGALRRRPRRRRPTAGTPRRRRSTRAASAIDPGDAVAAFNRANCLRAAGRQRRGGARLRAGDQARSRVRRGLVQPRRADGRARAQRARRGGTCSGRSRSTPTMPTRSSTSPRSSSRPATSPRRGAGGSATWSSTATPSGRAPPPAASGSSTSAGARTAG